MAFADLVSRLEQEAQSRVEAIRRAANDEVHTIEAATEQAVADITARQLQRGRVERHPAQQRALAAARQAARAGELETRHAQITRILERARALIPEVAKSPDYRAAVPAHLDEALSFLVGLRSRVRCQSTVVPVLQSTIEKHDGAALAIDETVGPGVIVEAADSSVTVDNTLAARLERSAVRLTIELARTLGDGDR